MSCEFAVCAPVYEAARPYFAAFARALAAAARPHSARVLLAVDGVPDAAAAFRPFLDGLRVEVIAAAEGSTPADVRRVLLQAAANLDADAIVMADCDDELESDALGLHGHALESADFSYADQTLIDETGRLLGRSLYAHWDVPPRAATIAPLLNGNFVGFSGFAVRRAWITGDVAAIPSAVRATDWWVASRLLLSGATGQQTSRPVVRYRQHAGNLHGGAMTSSALADVRHRAAIAAVHFEHLPDHPEVLRRAKATRQLVRRLSAEPWPSMPAIEAACRRPACWYADVVTLALQASDQGNAHE